MELIGSHGWNFGVEGSSFEEWATFGVAAAWFWAAMYRLGFFLAGHFEGPQRLLFLLPGCESTVIIPLEESLRWWFWVLAALLLGLLHPAEAWEPTVVAPFLDSEEVSPHCPALVPVREVVDHQRSSRWGNLYWPEFMGWLCWSLLSICGWEAFRCECRRRIEDLKQLRVRQNRTM